MTPAHRKDFLKLKMHGIGNTIDQITKTIDELRKMEDYTDLLCIGSMDKNKDFIILNGMPDDALDAIINGLEMWRKYEQDKRYYLKKELDTL